MITVIVGLVAFFAGGAIGFFTFALVAIATASDKDARLHIHELENLEK